MDPQFQPVKNAAYAGDYELFKSLLTAEPTLITSVSKDRGDSPNLIQFVVVEGGLGRTFVLRLTQWNGRFIKAIPNWPII